MLSIKSLYIYTYTCIRASPILVAILTINYLIQISIEYLFFFTQKVIARGSNLQLLEFFFFFEMEISHVIYSAKSLLSNYNIFNEIRVRISPNKIKRHR
jgi:hypothetical protein